MAVAALADKYSDLILNQCIDFLAYRIALHLHKIEKEEKLDAQLYS